MGLVWFTLCGNNNTCVLRFDSSRAAEHMCPSYHLINPSILRYHPQIFLPTCYFHYLTIPLTLTSLLTPSSSSQHLKLPHCASQVVSLNG